MVKANVDLILESLKEKNSISLGELSKKLSLSKQDIQKTAEYLEEDGIVKIEYKFPKTYVTLVKKTDTSSIGNLPPPPKADGDKQTQQEGKQTEQNQEQQTSENNGPQNQGQQPLPPPPSLNLTKPGEQAPPQANQGTQQTGPQPAQQNGQPQIQLQPVVLPSEQINNELNSAQHTDISQGANITVNTLSMQPAQQNNPTVNSENISKLPMENNAGIQNLQPTPEINDLSTQGINSDNNTLKPDAPIENDDEPKQPFFDMNAPTPVQRPTEFNSRNMGLSPIQDTNRQKTSIDRIESMIDEVVSRLSNRQYDNLNQMYRQIYREYHTADDLSPNERYLLAEKIEDIFERIKRIYLVEGVTN